MTPINEQIRLFLAKNFLLDDTLKLGDDDSLLDEGVIDSTGVLELVMFIESTFPIEVDDGEIVPENFDSVNRIAAYVTGKNNLTKTQ